MLQYKCSNERLPTIEPQSWTLNLDIARLAVQSHAVFRVGSALGVIDKPSRHLQD